MNDKINDGGPAFPNANPGYDGNWDDRRQIGGMTLRDYFAAKAIASLLITPHTWHELGFVPVNGLSELENNAVFAYRVADAMIKARQS